MEDGGFTQNWKLRCNYKMKKVSAVIICMKISNPDMYYSISLSSFIKIKKHDLEKKEKESLHIIVTFYLKIMKFLSFVIYFIFKLKI